MTVTRYDMNGMQSVVRGMAGQGDARSRMYRKWGARYLAYIKARYRSFSRGGGDWKDLSASTKLARRKGGKGRDMNGRFLGAGQTSTQSFAILIDTGTMFANLNHAEEKDGGIEVGFAKASHPGSGASVRDIAGFHDQGQGVPERKLIVLPDAATEEAMKRDLITAIQQASRHGT